MTKFIACINEISSAKVTSTLLVYELSANASHRQVAIDAHRLFLNRRQVDWKIWICIMTKISLFVGCMQHRLRTLAPSISLSRESLSREPRKKPSFRTVFRGAASVLLPARQVSQKCSQRDMKNLRRMISDFSKTCNMNHWKPKVNVVGKGKALV